MGLALGQSTADDLALLADRINERYQHCHRPFFLMELGCGGTGLVKQIQDRLEPSTTAVGWIELAQNGSSKRIEVRNIWVPFSVAGAQLCFVGEGLLNSREQGVAQQAIADRFGQPDRIFFMALQSPAGFA